MTTESSIKVSFELTKRDIKYFRERLKRTRTNRSDQDEAQLIKSASTLVQRAIEAESPDFVRIRLKTLEKLVEMVRDTEWRLEGRDRARVLDALAYFADPEDLIPDRIPGIGYIDDAIMIELVARELKHEIKSYDDFCAFRGQRGKKIDDEKLEVRRQSLQRRMRRRRRSDTERMRTTSIKSPFRLW
ncbi:MAG: DUF1232 domain-containing protein [Myxococcales bacterium]|nr:DUF1232 domain-containing protein [Myxococcales bacterium]